MPYGLNLTYILKL